MPLQVLGGGIRTLYWTLLEGLWGCSLGKRMLGLRVRTMAGDTPGLVRAFVRGALFAGAFGLGFVGSLVFRWLYLPRELTDEEVILYVNVMSPINLVGLIVGLTALLCPMRARNGYRGLHEFASGTRVVRLPPPPRRRTLRGDPPEANFLPAAEGLPARLGHFAVQGTLAADGGDKILLGSDPVLGRAVWLWVRPAGEPALSEARRQLGRATWPRWPGPTAVRRPAGSAPSGRRWCGCR